MKKALIISVILICFLSIIIYSCSKIDTIAVEEKTDINNFNNKEVLVVKSTSDHFLSRSRIGNVLFTYEAREKEGTFFSSLKIIDYGENRKLIESTFKLNTTKSGYKFDPYQNVIIEADRIKKEYGSLRIDTFTKYYEIFGKSLLSKLTDTKSDLVQSLFFHNAILNTIARSIKSNEDCGCTPHPAYLVGKLSFWCQEDYYINPRKIISEVDKMTYINNPIGDEAYEFLKENIDKESISYDKLYNIYESKNAFLKRIEFFRTKRNNAIQQHNKSLVMTKSECLLGTDLGCCGNYEGCCLFSSQLCLTHDIICLCCSEWHCGPACTPDEVC